LNFIFKIFFKVFKTVQICLVTNVNNWHIYVGWVLTTVITFFTNTQTTNTTNHWNDFVLILMLYCKRRSLFWRLKYYYNTLNVLMLRSASTTMYVMFLFWFFSEAMATKMIKIYTKKMTIINPRYGWCSMTILSVLCVLTTYLYGNWCLLIVMVLLSHPLNWDITDFKFICKYDLRIIIPNVFSWFKWHWDFFKHNCEKNNV